MKYSLGAKRNPSRQLKEYAGAILPPLKILTDISMIPVLDQAQQPACVGHAATSAVKYDYYTKTKIVPPLSPKWGYDVAKIIDGNQDEGTCALSLFQGLQAYEGFATTNTVPNDVALSVPLYSQITITMAMTEDAEQYPVKNDVEITNPTSLQLMSLIAEYGVAIIAVDVDEQSWMVQDGNVNLLPGNAGMHEVMLFGYETVDDDVRFFILNSWSATWGNNGTGTFLWSDYKSNVFDAMSIEIDMTSPIKMKPQHTFAVNLIEGMVGAEILALQQCLNYDPDTQVALDGPGSPGNESDVFGALTLNAVIKFQAKYNITPEAGYVGPVTRAQLNALYAAPILISDVIIQVESEGDVTVVGDTDLPQHAYGPMQIRQLVCDDVNTHFGTDYQAKNLCGLGALADCIDIFNKYMQIYCPNASEEVQSRTWNGGPNGPNEEATLAYWATYQLKKTALVAGSSN